MAFVLDIGGEGRHHEAWNLNPSLVKTVGPRRGEAIPRLILGRADAVPFADRSIDRVISERTPLTGEALGEIGRIIRPGGTILLRHAFCPRCDRHALARRILPGEVLQRIQSMWGAWIEESEFLVEPTRQSIAEA